MSHRVRNVSRSTIVATRVRRAVSFRDRLLGLMGRRHLEPGEGLLIEPCRSIHMFFMRFAIDAAFLDTEGRVVKRLSGLAPWRVSGIYPRAHSVLELEAGALQASDTHEGDRLVVEPSVVTSF